MFCRKFCKSAKRIFDWPLFEDDLSSVVDALIDVFGVDIPDDWTLAGVTLGVVGPLDPLIWSEAAEVATGVELLLLLFQKIFIFQICLLITIFRNQYYCFEVRKNCLSVL